MNTIGIDARLWNQTGVGRYIRNLSFNLLQIDANNQYVFFVLSSEKDEVESFLGEVSNKNWKLIIADVRWHSIAEQTKFLEILEKQDLDLMHFTYFSMPVRYKSPFVITIHDLIPYHISTGKASTLPYPLYVAKRLAYKYVLRKSVERAQKIIVPLESVKKDIIKSLHVPAEKIEVTLEGFDHVSFEAESHLDTAQFGKYFLYVGNAYPHKNLPTVINGFKDLLLREKNVNLVLVGRKDFFYERLKSEIGEQEIQNITFLLDVTDSDLVNLYKNSVALVSASRMEGFGLVPLEAFSAGTIPILSDIEAFHEVCGDAAYYFDCNKSSELTHKMMSVLLLDDQARKVYLTKGKKRLDVFSWNQTARQTLSVYESCTRV